MESQWKSTRRHMFVGGEHSGQQWNRLPVVAERVGRVAQYVIGGGKSTRNARSLFRGVAASR